MSREWGTSDVAVPSLAGVWDALLDGKNGYIADREAAWELREAFPGWRELAEMQRHFTVRAIDYLVGEAGVAQLIEIGCGFPPIERMLKLHEIARLTNEDARLLYVDHDPLVAAHARALLAERGAAAAIQADITDPASILEQDDTRALLDLDQPYAVLLSGVLQHLTDEQDPAGVVETLKASMPAGSYLAVCNLLGGDALGVVPATEEAERAWDKAMGGRAFARFRDWEEHRRYVAGLELVPPGLVYADEWRPDEHLREATREHTLMCAGVGRIPRAAS